MPRLASTLVVFGLLAGTAAAFAITEALKLERTPITRPQIERIFSPVAERDGTADIGFRLRKGDRITVSIVDSEGETVRTLVQDVGRRRGRVQLFWDGRDDAGRLVPEGRYRPRVRLARQRRTIVIPNLIEVDVTPPEIELRWARPRVISPDRDGRAELVRVRFGVGERARPLLLVDGTSVVRGRLERRGGVIRWFGKLHGQVLPAGTYELALRGEDRAGNVSPATPAVPIRVRYVELRRSVLRARPGGRLRVNVSTDAERLRWRLAGRSGVAARRTLVVRAPARPGRYTLYVSANDHADRATVVVGRR